ncbi:hypothetical protein [Pseudobutyrivibrio sp.]
MFKLIKELFTVKECITTKEQIQKCIYFYDTLLESSFNDYGIVKGKYIEELKRARFVWIEKLAKLGA